ncbi:hypothetical protein [Streptomyces fulvorobeus]|uniref:Uncharacterized protein n=1 Tax=Streptomyces fulvorobeus TaxID=284028 RepID=A0A7Y9HI61_9ACTN|nr:hypothetical protein [Streptomyces fulvorobeus]NYE44850.1 hypothetical protein [Streptomyces fulvorobeus]
MALNDKKTNISTDPVKCCGRSMTSSSGQLVCGRCGAWVQPGVTS